MGDSQLDAITELRELGAHFELDEAENAVALRWGGFTPMTEAGLSRLTTLKSLIDVT